MKTKQTDLIERLQNPNDHHAWQEFDKAYRSLIYNSALYYGLASQDAEDFTQTLLLKLWSKIPNSHFKREKGDFQAWLKRVIYNSAMDFHRGAKKALKKFEGFPEQSPEPEIDVKANEEWQNYTLTRAMKTIQTHFNEKALKVFQLCLDGWSTSDISSHMDIKENTIYQLRRRVKIKIRNELKLISYE